MPIWAWVTLLTIWQFALALAGSLWGDRLRRRARRYSGVNPGHRYRCRRVYSDAELSDQAAYFHELARDIVMRVEGTRVALGDTERCIVSTALLLRERTRMPYAARRAMREAARRNEQYLLRRRAPDA